MIIFPGSDWCGGSMWGCHALIWAFLVGCRKGFWWHGCLTCISSEICTSQSMTLIAVDSNFFLLNGFTFCSSSSMYFLRIFVVYSFGNLFLHRWWRNTPVAITLSFRHCKKGLWLSHWAKSSSSISIPSHLMLCDYYPPACWRRKCVHLSFV